MRLDPDGQPMYAAPVRVAIAEHYRRIALIGTGPGCFAAVQPAGGEAYVATLQWTLDGVSGYRSLIRPQFDTQFRPRVERVGSTALAAWFTNYGAYYARLNRPDSMEARAGTMNGQDYALASSGKEFLIVRPVIDGSNTKYRIELLSESGVPVIREIALPGGPAWIAGAGWDGRQFVIVWASFDSATPCAHHIVRFARVSGDGAIFGPKALPLPLDRLFGLEMTATKTGMLMAYNAETLGVQSCEDATATNSLRLAAFDSDFNVVRDEAVETLGGWWDAPIAAAGDGAGTNVILFPHQQRSPTGYVSGVKRAVVVDDDGRILQPAETVDFDAVAWNGRTFLFARAKDRDVVIAEWNGQGAPVTAAPSTILFSAASGISDVRLAHTGDAITYQRSPFDRISGGGDHRVMARAIDDVPPPRRRRGAR
jgi:hypothetical protein